MADVIKTFNYSKTSGRGRGILGLTNFEPCRRPGERTVSAHGVRQTAGAGQQTGSATTRRQLAMVGDTQKPGAAVSEDRQSAQAKNDKSEAESCLLIASHRYKADPTMPRGFPELSLEKGQLVEFIKEHPDDEDWWQAKNESGDIGYVPSTYVIVKKEIALPWLQWSALQSEEEERKKRVQRVAMKKAAAEGKGFGPPPKPGTSGFVPKPYVSAYAREQPGPNQSAVNSYYCDVCEKKFNGPKPYQAHMVSKAHKEELALRDS